MIAFGSPGRYLQGNGAIDKAGELLKPLGSRFLLLADEVVLEIAGNRIEDSLKKAGLSITTETFQGECCDSEIKRLTQCAENIGAQVIIGMGGGKAADTAKMINIRTGRPVVIAPTVASTDAPTSQLAVVYDESHVKQGVFFMNKGPDLVLVDTGIIAKAPLRTMRAGIGDALSTSFEAEACFASHSSNMFGFATTRASLALARLSWDILRKHAIAALTAVEGKEVTGELEAVIEATILLSGLGFESGGLAAAHAIHGGFTSIEEMKGALHGELVAFGVLAQCVLENRDESFMADLLNFYKDIGLPLTLADLGLKDGIEDALSIAVEKICVQGSYIYHMPFSVDKKSVLRAIKKADRFGSA